MTNFSDLNFPYIEKYYKNGAYDLSALINDDLIEPFRYLFKGGFYVSSLKLALITIDSLGYVEFGDVTNPNPFIKWADCYMNLKSLGFSSLELYEHRNALLHMSRIDSRKVNKGETRKLEFYIGNISDEISQEISMNTGHGFYSLSALFKEIGAGVGAWLEKMIQTEDSRITFLERYGEIITSNRSFEILHK